MKQAVMSRNARSAGHIFCEREYLPNPNPELCCTSMKTKQSDAEASIPDSCQMEVALERACKGLSMWGLKTPGSSSYRQKILKCAKK